MKAPPLLVGYRSPQAILKQTEGFISESEASKFLSLAERGYPPVSSLNSLALLFQYSRRILVAMALRPARYYRRFSVSKGSGQRRIDAPRVALKVIQSWFGHHLARAIEYNECVHGFVPGRSAITAAREHCKAQWVLSLDIKEFFPSIDEARVVNVLKKVGYSAPASRLLARLFTLDGRLPQGAPTSPVLSNLAFSNTDKRLVRLAAQHNMKYTRYVDDLTFSSETAWPGNILLDKIIGAIHADSWVIAKRKTRLTLAPHRMSVLGLVVNGEQPRLSKKFRNRIRLMHHLLATGNCSEIDQLRFKGHIAYAKSVGS